MYLCEASTTVESSGRKSTQSPRTQAPRIATRQTPNLSVRDQPLETSYEDEGESLPTVLHPGINTFPFIWGPGDWKTIGANV